MFEDFSLFPDAASSYASRVDSLYLFLCTMTAVASFGILCAVVFLSVRYRRRADRAAEQLEGSLPLEIFWSAIPAVLFVGIFAWAAKLYLEMYREPADCMEFYVTGKQWMWKIQHPTGQREINTLHIPVGRPVKLTMISEDVIHDFYVPAFRIKRDVVPGLYTSEWFEATKVGTYHLFCAEYCGTKHSEMIGSVIVMEPAEYEAWLGGQPASQDPVEAGRVLFENLRCVTCHDAGKNQRGPDLHGRFGETVGLANGTTVLFDEAYTRTSILEPKHDIAVGFEPVMPTYEGQVTETQIQQLIAYVKSLATDTGEGQQK
ncbi:MAG TPA: cytochrome c oxidase subunit II [Planctomycetes bacterium]|nr:cytochrome c oxidase subunit II [Planctomycetota bacterium]